MAGLGTDLCGIQMATPIVLSAGTCGYVDEMADAIDLARVGAVTTKSITLEPRLGHDPPRILHAKAGMLNAIGLANIGLERFLAEKVQITARVPTKVIGSVAGGSVAEYVEIAGRLDQVETIPFIELNLSCPNTDDGRSPSDDPATLGALVAEVRAAVTGSRLLVKMPPRIEGMLPLAAAAIDAGADALSLINTIKVMSIDVQTRRSRLSRTWMGLSGPALHPLAMRLVHEVHSNVARDAGIPIIGIGGVLQWEDAAGMILAGASAVGMGTALYVDPRSPMAVAQGLERWMRQQGCDSIDQLVGAFKE